MTFNSRIFAGQQKPQGAKIMAGYNQGKGIKLKYKWLDAGQNYFKKKVSKENKGKKGQDKPKRHE